MKRTLIHSATIITMDDRIGDVGDGDVLVEDGRIAAVRPGIDAADAEIVDGRGGTVIPGLVNAYMHTWQTALRGWRHWLGSQLRAPACSAAKARSAR
ncbi:cytosine/adenosine deaminase-related metal-dependent hydrolase [Bradyrhizobium sp. USDA 4472]